MISREPIFRVHAELAEILQFGPTPYGQRRVINILGGRVEGAKLSGRILPGGADWQLIQPDGFSELDTRYTLETAEGQRVYVQNAGIRHAPPDVMQKLLAGQTVDPKLVYFRTVPKFETASPELQWLTRSVFIGIGERYPSDVRIRFFKLE